MVHVPVLLVFGGMARSASSTVLYCSSRALLCSGAFGLSRISLEASYWRFCATGALPSGAALGFGLGWEDEWCAAVGFAMKPTNDRLERGARHRWLKRLCWVVAGVTGAFALSCSGSAEDTGGHTGGSSGGAGRAGSGGLGGSGGAGGSVSLACIGNEVVCGLNCCAVGQCDALGGYSMKLEPVDGRCRMTITDPSVGNAVAFLACDGSVEAFNPDGKPNDQPGTWTGSGTSFTLAIDGFDHACKSVP